LLTSTDRIDRQLVAEALLDIRLIEDEHVRVEYTGLLKARFASLGARQQERLLEVLASRGLSAGESRTLSIDERALRRDRLILGRLQLVERHLKGRWRKRYEALRARTSSPIRWDDPNPTVEVSVGDRSPLDIEELKKLDVSQIVDYLRSWQPPEGEWEASPDGLGRVLTVVVEHNAARFSEAASQFRELDPTYISWLLHGLHAAVRAGTPLVWEPVVSLCAWVVAQPRDEKAWRRSRYSDLDPGWAWTRKAVATLISDGLRQPSQALPIHLRQNVGNVLNILCEDPHPTREDENRHGGDAMDAYQFSVNATRSEALEALIAYALWVQSSLTKLEDSGRTFDLVPDARAILDRHLDPEYDPSRAVRATYGRWFGNLYYADAKWAVENIAKIFPREPDREGLRVAAWESFLWNRPHAAIYKALQGEYELAIERMNMTVKRNAHTRDPRARLGIHLSILFISGGLPVKDAHVISDFFANAPVDIRTAVIADVARNLRQSPTLPATTLERVKELWNLRLNAVGITDNSDLGTFGEWFASERIEDDWGYPHLAAALSQGGRLPGGHNVIKKLAKDAAHRTTQALDCLDLIIDGEKSEWHIEFWKDDITTVLRTGLASALDSDRRRARETANRLVARGYASYSELLANIQPDSSG
jgi:hypothetical protein